MLEQTIRQVSDPSSPQYGRYLSRDQLYDIMKPPVVAEKAVLDWLKAAGIEKQENNGNWISFTCTVKQADDLMDARFLTYRSTSKQDLTIVRTRDVFLPQNIVHYVQLIHPTTHFSKVRDHVNSMEFLQRTVDDNSAVSCDALTTPTCLRDLYRIGGVVPDAQSGFIGIAGFLGEYPAHSDLDIMIAKTAPWAKGANYTSYSLKG